MDTRRTKIGLMAHMEFCKALEDTKEILVGSKGFLWVLEGTLGF